MSGVEVHVYVMCVRTRATVQANECISKHGPMMDYYYPSEFNVSAQQRNIFECFLNVFPTRKHCNVISLRFVIKH